MTSREDGHLEAILGDLNEAQLGAVKARLGPTLVIAGAGSGKTRVLTRRIAYLLAQGASPFSILAITFTNRSAMEMKSRVEELVGENGARMWVSTFHSACLRILRSHAQAVGYRPSFVVYDQSDSKRLIELVVKQLELDPKRFPARSIQAVISQAKSQMIDPVSFGLRAHGLYEERITSIYERYQSRLMAANAMDFDDLLFHAVLLFRRHAEVLEYYQRRFEHLLVDEFQDTNAVQNELVILLGATHRSVFVVGDADQSIYRFRGADISNILEFENGFPEAEVVRLEQNYRSTQTILEAANAIISHNPQRYAKTLWSEGAKGDPITVFRGEDDRAEARFISEQIAKSTSRGERAFSDFAVLYRTNSQSRSLEEELIRRTLPYRVIGGTRFYDRREVKDMIAYLRLIVNRDDEVSLRRVINVPKRGIGDTALAKLASFAASTSSSLFLAARNAYSSVISGKQQRALTVFAEMIDRLEDEARYSENVAEVIDAIMEQTGYLADLKAEGGLEGESRIENIEELKSLAASFADVGSFLEETALFSSSDEVVVESSVTLMTLHSAKGLEFPVVFIAGLEEGIFPHMRAFTDPSELEEERRLCYVGVTRAKEKLYLTHAVQRFGYGERSYNPPSRFITEIPESLVEFSTSNLNPVSSSTFRDSESHPGPPTGLWPKKDPFSVSLSKALSGLVAGDVVLHTKWGEGIVMEVRGKGEKMEALIHFRGFGDKLLLVALAPIKLI